MREFVETLFYNFFRFFFGMGLRIFYKEITVSGIEKVPLNSPIITASNHPTGLMDAFLASHFIKRVIKFTAAGGLFKDRLQAAFLTSTGAIPLYRRKDTPDDMDKNVESFELCFKELEAGGAIGFFPEGTSHPEPWINPIKTGTARIALQTQERNNFKLKLKIVPIGINSPQPGIFRGSVFVNFGNPISLEKYHDLYREDAAVAVEQLTEEVQQEMESAALHIKDDLLLKLVEDIKIIGFEEVKFDGRTVKNKAQSLYFVSKALEEKITRKEKSSVIESNEDFKELHNFTEKTGKLKHQMQQLGLIDHPFKGIRTILEFIYFLFILILGFPIALPGIVANILPFLLAKKLGKKLAGQDLSLIPAARMMMGAVIYLLYYSFMVIFISVYTGLIKSIMIILFLFISGYITLWYWEGIKTLIADSRKIYLWFFKREMIRRLLSQRDELLYHLFSWHTV